jgi:hypothetical protein
MVLGTNARGAEVGGMGGMGCNMEPQASMVLWLSIVMLEVAEVFISGTVTERGLRLDGLIILVATTGLPALAMRVGDRETEVLERTGEA